MSLFRVFEIPEPTDKYHFDGGQPVTFIEVDWFTDEALPSPISPGELETMLVPFIKNKQYYSPDKAYLVLYKYHSFTINLQD